MFEICYGEEPRVVENCSREIERNIVFLQIGRSFDFVPFELKLRFIQR